jgi:hypothetical protein
VAPPRKPGPDDEELRRWRDAGLTQMEMAQKATEKYGTPWSRQHIATRMSRAGLSDEGMRYSETVPWKVRTAHSKHYRLQLLRSLGRREMGLPPTNELWDRRLDKFLRETERLNVVVAYNPAAADDAPQDEVFPFVDRSSIPPMYLHPKYPISTYDPAKMPVSPAELLATAEEAEAEAARLEAQARRLRERAKASGTA